MWVIGLIMCIAGILAMFSGTTNLKEGCLLLVFIIVVGLVAMWVGS